MFLFDPFAEATLTPSGPKKRDRCARTVTTSSASVHRLSSA